MLEARATRRRFLRGLAAGGVVAASAGWRSAGAELGAPATLTGAEFDLVIGTGSTNLTGRRATATVVNGSLPAPTLHWREGDTVTLRVRNTLAAETSIHWHGILLPAEMDGVPGVSFAGIHPGETFTYRFPVRQGGTYWYHAHSGFQEQQGLYGALIVQPREPEPFAYERDHVVLLSDWTDRDPLELYKLLKRRPGYFNYNDRTLRDLARDARDAGLGNALAERLDWGRMRMKPSDLADIGGHGYTYLMNGTAPAGNWTGLFAPGERVRLRFINGSAMSIFDVRIPGLRMRVVAADGQHVRPVEVDEFRLTAAETLDVVVEPVADAYTIFAQSKDRAGYACGTLAARAGAVAPVPAPDAIAYLGMADMGHGAGDHGAHAAAGAAASGAAAAAAAASGAAAAAASGAAAEHVHPSAPAAPAHDHAPQAAAAAQAPQDHPASERRNPGVDMQPTVLAPRLDDPGVGLRGNGRRVLTYADLQSAFADPDGREPERTIELHLTGHMERFIWSFDGVRFSEARPIELRFGERVRFVLANDTMMEHPIHLHGMWSDLEDEQGNFRVRKHTIAIPPGTRRSVRVTADALGPWAFHCHLLFHMEAGMFRIVRVGDGPPAEHEHVDEAHRAREQGGGEQNGGEQHGGEHAR